MYVYIAKYIKYREEKVFLINHCLIEKYKKATNTKKYNLAYINNKTNVGRNFWFSPNKK